MNTNLRLYTFTNFYLSSIQVGIQTAHVVSEMMLNNSHPLVKAWAKYGKTIICLNGGNNKQLHELNSTIIDEANDYNQFHMKIVDENKKTRVFTFPTANFYEDEESLNSTLTCVGIILPPEIYEMKYTESNFGGFYSGLIDDKMHCISGYDKFMKILKNSRLAS